MSRMDIEFAAKGVGYWVQVPVVLRISDIEFTTALFPRDGRYLLQLKDAVRRSAGIEVDQVLAASNASSARAPKRRYDAPSNTPLHGEAASSDVGGVRGSRGVRGG